MENDDLLQTDKHKKQLIIFSPIQWGNLIDDDNLLTNGQGKRFLCSFNKILIIYKTDLII